MNYEAMIESLPSWKYAWHICGECGGDGKHSKHLGSFSMEELNEDPDFRDDYFAGGYDKECNSCRGSGKIKGPKPGALSFGELRKLLIAFRDKAPEGPWWANCPMARAEMRFGA